MALSKDRVAQLVTDYINAWDSVPRAARAAKYDWGKLPGRLSGTWLAYGQMFEEYSREIANNINYLITAEARLGAWETTMKPLDQETVLELYLEFVDALATVAINLPAAIRDRFIFASAHLCHQANLTFGGADWVDNLRKDHQIELPDAQKAGKRWTAFSAFETALLALGSRDDYERKIGNFRNRYHHRFAQRIGIGLSELIRRGHDPETGKPCYAFGGAEPLSLDHIRAFLRQQIERAQAVNGAFIALIREHEAAIVAWEARQAARQGTC